MCGVLCCSEVLYHRCNFILTHYVRQIFEFCFTGFCTVLYSLKTKD